MIDSAVAGAAPFLPVRLIVFPEFAHAAPVFPTVAELLEEARRQIPNEHTERLRTKAREARRLHSSRHRCSRAIRSIPAMFSIRRV